MDAKLEPLPQAKVQEIRELFVGRRWQLLIGAIRAERDKEVLEVTGGLVELAMNPSVHLDRETLQKAVSLKIACDVLDEFASPEKEYFDLRIDQ